MRYLLTMLVVTCGAASSNGQDAKIGGKSVKDWSSALKSADAKVRYKALAALYEEGAEAAPLVKELTPLLKDSQVSIRRGVAQVLGNCKADAVSAVPALIAAFRDSDMWVRQYAANALMDIGAPAGDRLIKLLDEKDAVTRFHAIVVINGLSLAEKDVIQALGKATKDSTTSVRQAALFALSKIDTNDPEVFAILGAALADKDKQVRLSAAQLLVGKGRDGSAALAKAAEDPKAAARLYALQLLGSLGDDIDEKGVLALRKALADDDVKIRQTAALGLANLGAKARLLGGDKELFADLAQLLKDKDAPLRRTVVFALGQIGSEDADESKVVAAALKDADAMVRSYAVQALAKYVKDALAEDTRKENIAHLVEALKDTDRRVQFLSAQTLTQQKLDAVESLTKVVEDGKGPQRLWAAAILGEIGPGVFDAIPALEKMAKDGNAEARRVAMLALQKIMGEKK